MHTDETTQSKWVRPYDWHRSLSLECLASTFDAKMACAGFWRPSVTRLNVRSSNKRRSNGGSQTYQTLNITIYHLRLLRWWELGIDFCFIFLYQAIAKKNKATFSCKTVAIYYSLMSLCHHFSALEINFMTLSSYFGSLVHRLREMKLSTFICQALAPSSKHVRNTSGARK